MANLALKLFDERKKIGHNFLRCHLFHDPYGLRIMTPLWPPAIIRACNYVVGSESGGRSSNTIPEPSQIP